MDRKESFSKARIFSQMLFSSIEFDLFLCRMASRALLAHSSMSITFGRFQEHIFDFLDNSEFEENREFVVEIFSVILVGCGCLQTIMFFPEIFNLDFFVWYSVDAKKK